jgi:hypothetical protein
MSTQLGMSWCWSEKSRSGRLDVSLIVDLVCAPAAALRYITPRLPQEGMGESNYGVPEIYGWTPYLTTMVWRAWMMTPERIGYCTSPSVALHGLSNGQSDGT